MKNTKIIITFLAIFLLQACTFRQNYNLQLVKADSLMKSRPDSALSILLDVPAKRFTTWADSAYYALLLTQAQDKNFIVQKNDSLIQIAVRYYDSIRDIKMQAKAHYYLGCVWRDKGDHLRAIGEYHLSHTFAKEEEDKELQALIYSNIAYLYYIQDLNIEADSVYRLAVQFAIQQNDTISLIYALSQRGMINFEKGKYHYPEAEQQMRQALLLAEHFSDTTVKTPVYASLSTLYCEMEEVEKALQYAKLNYYSKKDTLHRCRASLLLGDAYFKCEQYDSAELYLRKVFVVDRHYVTKADACMRLAEIEKIRGKIETVAELREKQIIYMDSAQRNLQKYDVLQGIMFQERKDNESFRKQYNSTIIFIPIFAIIVAIVLISNIRGGRKQQFTEELRKEELQIEVDLLTSRKRALVKEDYENSIVYIKLKSIARTLIKVETNENLTEEEWQQLVAMTDKRWNGIITYLNEIYSLSAEEIHICCLYLAEIPVTYVGHFINGYARSTIQLKARDIIQKMGIPQGRLLKNVLLSLAQELIK